MQNHPAHPSILALGYSEAAMLLRQAVPGEIKAVISICGAHEYAVDAPDISHRLVLHFDDIEAVNLSDPVSAHANWAKQKWAAEMGRTTTPPTTTDAQAIIDFACGLSNLNGTVLCQCQAGVSRSPAAALLCLATWTGAGKEDHCVDELLRIRPCSMPLKDLISFGDSLLGRNGNLVNALAVARQRMV